MGDMGDYDYKSDQGELKTQSKVIHNFEVRNTIDCLAAHILEKLKSFLMEFTSVDFSGRKKFKYARQLTEIAHRDQVSLRIDLSDLETYVEGAATEYEGKLAQRVQKNSKRYLSMLYNIVQELLPDYKEREVTAKDALGEFLGFILYGHSLMLADIYIEHRQLMEQRLRGPQANQSTLNPFNKFPPELMRRYEIYLKPAEPVKSVTIRQIKAEHVGSLVTVRGIVTRCTEVKPLLTVATYTCDQCGSETYQPVSL